MKQIGNKIGIKGVRLSLDHLEIITEWMEEQDLSCIYSTTRIDNEYVTFSTIQTLIDSQGTSPRSIAILGKNQNSELQVFFHLQYCMIQSTNIHVNLTEKIRSLMKKTLPLLFRIIPFKWFFLITNLIFIFGIFGYFVFDYSYQFLIGYTVYPAIVIALTIFYNNRVNKINLIRIHQKTSFWSRTKDKVYTSLLLALVIIPFIKAAIDYLWPIVKKYFMENSWL